MQNATGKIRLDLSELYDVLKSKLLALESLGRTQEKFASWSRAYRKPCYGPGRGAGMRKQHQKVLSEIKEKGIIAPDLCNSVNEIDMLLGADVVSVISSGRSIKLWSGLMAIGTMLEFTLMGKSNQEVNDNTEVSVPAIRERQLSMFLNQLNIKELWDLETIGIRDPVENIKKRVTETEIETDAYYLPHRTVFKISETTKIRPVFDATAREGNNPSLNDCLLKSPNLIELIPDILDRFRMYPIGLSADIEKAFLQISVTPEHRDFLRFFHPHENKEIVYRHCRLVFGVCSSPFLLAASINYLLDNIPSKYMDIVSKLRHSFMLIIVLPEYQIRKRLGHLSIRYNAGPVKSESVSLPADRVRDADVFEVIDIDLAGPLFFKKGEKVWVVLYTCAVYRAVHLKLTYEELLTVLCDCESIINSRSLTYVSEDSDDLIPLTPAMFMMSNVSLDMTDLDLSDFARFQKRVKFRAWLLKDLRGRFRKEYLGLLVQKAHKTTRALKSAEMGESNDVPLDAEAFKITSAGVDVSESAIHVNAPPNMPKVSRYGRIIKRPRRLNVLNVTTVSESE
ncbi:putative RNA-directed DNA polymerase from transposon X-element [Trichonephila clavipes]|nr:putative RNA-directed DNA polymerase from transposon X-element [Trichonephila clavipes]